MKRKFTFLATFLFASQLLFAGTPVIDGVFDGTGVWGNEVGSGDGNAGWAGANARRLYITYDDNYVYLGASCNAQTWHSFVFAVNTKPNGSSTDSWGRLITYNHFNKPDFLFRGDVRNSNYAEFHSWNGSSWNGLGNNVNAGGTEVKGTFNAGNEGFLELRISRSLISYPLNGDVQFIMTGDNNTHGNFDAIPNDQTMNSWDAPGNATSVSNYIGFIPLPANLGIFAGELREKNVQLQWNTLTEQNLSGFGIERSIDARTWDNVGFVAAQNNASGAIYNHSVIKSGASVQFYRLKITDKDGSFVHSKLVVIKSQPKAKAELIGNPVTSVINVAIHTPTPERIQAELIDQSGRRVSNTNYQHSGGSSVMQISTSNMSSGSYILRLNGTETHETIRVVKAK
jgi:hypothetical protein